MTSVPDMLAVKLVYPDGTELYFNIDNDTAYVSSWLEGTLGDADPFHGTLVFALLRELGSWIDGVGGSSVTTSAQSKFPLAITLDLGAHTVHAHIDAVYSGPLRVTAGEVLDFEDFIERYGDDSDDDD